MRAISVAALAGLAFAVCTGAVRPQAQGCAARAPDPGYRLLFDGTANGLSGWAIAGPGAFELQADCTLRSSGGLGLFWYRAAPFASPFTLQVQWLTPDGDNSGVFVGFPPVGDDPFVAVNRGYEIQIDPTDKPAATTGAIYGFQAADQAVRDRVLNPAGQWNTFEITVDAPRIVVRLNGAVVNRFVSRDPARQDLGRGFMGVQNHSDADTVFVRSVQVKEWGARRPRCAHPAAPHTLGDAFAGTRLNRCRWNRIVRYDGGGVEVAGGALHLEVTDDARPSNLVLQRSRARNWTIETTVHASSGAAGLIVYKDDGHFVRLVSAPGLVRLASATHAVTASRPHADKVRLRLHRSGSRYTGFSSVDGRSWTRVGSVANATLGADAAVGVLAVGASRAGRPSYATFERFAATAG